MEKGRLQPTRIQPVRIKRSAKENRRIMTEQDDSKPSSLLRGRNKALSTEKSGNGYTTEQLIGKGTFGAVYKGRDNQGRVVAIKRVLQDKNFKNREQQILKMLDHGNVLSMRDSYFTQSGTKIYLNVVMDYYPTDLYSLLKNYSKKKTRMPNDLVKRLARQMFLALDYLATLRICHRDIKPQNILVDVKTAGLVICDFGSAKVLEPKQANISYICSRSYRAPELIFGATHYTTQVDVWSIACVLVEMITGRVLFTAPSNAQQMIEIIKVIGTPSKEQILAMNPNNDPPLLPKIGPAEWSKVMRGGRMQQSLVDLISKLLVYDPTKRLSPRAALSHSFFM